MPHHDYIGIDLGGTTVTAGLVRNGEITVLKTVPTGRHRPPRDIFETIAEIIGETAADSKIDGIGVGVPVPAGPETVSLEPSDNLPTLGGFQLKTELETRFGVSVVLENDARCMTLGELRAGALKGCSACVCMTLGTGLGCGIVIDGSLYRGGRYFAGEIWLIPRGDGTTQEDAAAVRGIEAAYRSLAGETVPPHVIYERYTRGEEEAVNAFLRYGASVGGVIVMVIAVLDPERVALGGGLARAYDAFKPGMIEAVTGSLGEDAAAIIVPAALSDKAAVIGAAALIKEIVESEADKLPLK